MRIKGKRGRRIVSAFLFTSVSLLSLLPGIALAQSEDNSIERGDEIIVTAQKRSQSVQDVGITMSVISSQVIARTGITEINELTKIIPNLQANVVAGQANFSMRGIGTNEFSANLDSPVAVNVDEIYLSKNFMTGLVMFDIDRVESLKGPQGTLFGRNATGGAVNFYTRRPSENFGTGATIGYDNYRTFRFEGFVTGPLSDSISARISGQYVDQDRGWYRNLTRGVREGGDKKAAVRAQIQWRGSDTNINLTGAYGEIWGLQGAYQGLGIFTPQSLAMGEPAFCAGYLAGHVRGDDPDCVRGTDGLNPGSNDPWVSRNDLSHKVNNKYFLAALRVEQDLNWATLTSISSYQSFTRDQREDSDNSPSPSFDVYYYNRIREFTQEVRLSSVGESRWNYVVGAYYQHDFYRNGDYLVLGGGASPGYYSPFDQKVDALAVFMNNDVELTDNLSLIAGLRYSWERISFSGGTYVGIGLTGSPERPATILGTTAFKDDSHTDDDATFKIGLQWKPTLDIDWVNGLMIYGHVSTGFRSGAYIGEFVGSQDALNALSPERITAYEVGFKSTLADRRLMLNGAVFHYAFKDGFINVDSPTSPVPVTINAATIDTWGAELDLVWHPFDVLSISMGGGWLDSNISSDITVSGESLKGNQTVQSPRWTYNVQASLDQPIGGDLVIGIAADASWRSQQYFETVNSINSRESSYWLVNGRISLRSDDEFWSVSVWGKNLTNRAYRTYVNDLPGFGFLLNNYGPPRSYGLSLSFKY